MSHNGHRNGLRGGQQDDDTPGRANTPDEGADWTEQYTQELVSRVAAACRGQKPTPLATKLSLHPETVRRYLNGQRPSPEFLAALTREMGVSAAWLLLGEGDMYRPGQKS
jgi:hypothetical protein